MSLLRVYGVNTASKQRGTALNFTPTPHPPSQFPDRAVPATAPPGGAMGALLTNMSELVQIILVF